jgi:hypothetical protein
MVSSGLFLITFFSEKKVTKNLVALKTRLNSCSIALFPGLLSRLFVFHVLFHFYNFT